MRNQQNCPDGTNSETKPKEPFHFITKEELLEYEEKIRQASIDAYKEQCRQSRERRKSSKYHKDNEWKRINSGVLELDGRWE